MQVRASQIDPWDVISLDTGPFYVRKVVDNTDSIELTGIDENDEQEIHSFDPDEFVTLYFDIE